MENYRFPVEMLRVIADHYSACRDQIAAWCAHASPEKSLVLEAARAVQHAIAGREASGSPPYVRTEQLIGPRLRVDLAVFREGVPQAARDITGAWLFEFKMFSIFGNSGPSARNRILADWTRVSGLAGGQNNCGLMIIHHHVEQPTPGLRWDRWNAKRGIPWNKAEKNFKEWIEENGLSSNLHSEPKQPIPLSYLNEKAWLKCNLLLPD